MISMSVKPLAACVAGCWVLAASTPATAQQAFEVLPTVSIPRETYNTWSLFLVCNPAWLVQNGDNGIAELFNQYRAFGRSIGDKNLAIWFWKQPAVRPTADNTDTNRSGNYCERFKLLPSNGPHVLVTTGYPDDPEPGDRVVVSLNGLDARNSALMLNKLADQMLVSGLNQRDLDAGVRWRRMFAAVGSAIGAVGCYFNKASFSFKTGAITAEIEHSSVPGTC